MTTIVQRDPQQPIRSDLTWTQTWQDADRGLIRCWEIGRERALRSAELAQRCQAGELPLLGWKGGVERRLKKLDKFGSLNYLAQWYGLRQQALSIDLNAEYTLVCARTGMIVTFTADRSKYLDQAGEGEFNENLVAAS